MPLKFDDSYVRRWRDRAKEMRNAAVGMTSDAKEKVLRLAEEWDLMADRLEARLRDGQDR